MSHKSNWIKAEVRALGELFHGLQTQLKIPFQQRPWQWKNARIDSLLEDLFTTHKKNYIYTPGDIWRKLATDTAPAPHFFGSVILLQERTLKDEAAAKQIIDGQQRITAVTLIFCHLKILAKELELEAGNRSLNRSTVSARNLVAGIDANWLYLDVGEGVKRVKADQMYQSVFDKFLVEPLTRGERDTAWNELSSDNQANETSRRFKASYERVMLVLDKNIKVQLDSQQNLNEEGKIEYRLSYIKTLIDCLSNHFAYIHIDLDNEIYASEVFTSLNSKQQQLLQADLIKAYVFRACPDSEEAIKANIAWHNLIRSQPNTTEFFKKLFLSRAKKPSETLRDDQIAETYEKTELKECKNSGIVEIVTEWQSLAVKLSTLLDTSNGFFDQQGTLLAFNLLERLKLKGAEMVFLAMLQKATYLKLSMSDKQRIVKLLTDYGFRTVKVGRGKADPFIEKCIAVCCILNTAKDFSEVERRILDLLKDANDSEFRLRFEGFATKEPNLQFYILYQFEERLSNNNASKHLTANPSRLKNHIEHILPQKLDMNENRRMEWANWRDRDDHPNDEHDAYLNRLGNLCLLEFDSNTTVKNFSFDVKRSGIRPPIETKRRSKKTNQPIVIRPKPLLKSYRSSGFKLVGQIVSDSWDEAGRLIPGVPLQAWGPDEIDARQKWMADEALKIWSLK